MSKKHYVVFVGVNPGIYPNWEAAKAQVHGFSGAQYRSFPSHAEAKRQYDKFLKKNTRKGSKPTQKANPRGKQEDSQSKAEIAGATLSDGLVIYCDGGCDPNPGEAGAGLAIYCNGELTELLYGAYEESGTNNTAELNGMIKALDYAAKKALVHPSITIFCDSKYVVQSLTEWAPGWQARGWKKADGKPVQNKELIQKALSLYNAVKSLVEIKHVRGHKGVIGNELADRMALKAVRSKSTEFLQHEIPESLGDLLLNS